MKDSISDLFTRIRNARSNYRKNIYITKNRINTQIVDILYRQGLINSYKLSKNCLIFNLKYEKKKSINYSYLSYKSSRMSSLCSIPTTP